MKIKLRLFLIGLLLCGLYGCRAKNESPAQDAASQNTAENVSTPDTAEKTTTPALAPPAEVSSTADSGPAAAVVNGEKILQSDYDQNKGDHEPLSVTPDE